MSHWVFGYASLVWRPDFAHNRVLPAYVVGFERRFWQASTDHRGTPESPGRVATLIESRGTKLWGMAYEVDPDDWETVQEELDYREKGGYSRHKVAVHNDAGDPFAEALLYVGTADNPNFAGDAPLEDIAGIIRAAHGPSGPNTEYLFRLADALRKMGAHDEHVFALERLVRSST